MTRPFFSRDRITHFDIFDRYVRAHSTPSFHGHTRPCSPQKFRHAEHALDKVAARLREGIPVDWQDVVSRFTMDSATEFLFGKDVRSLDAPLPYPSTARTPFMEGGAAEEVHPADRFVRAFSTLR